MVYFGSECIDFRASKIQDFPGGGGGEGGCTDAAPRPPRLVGLCPPTHVTPPPHPKTSSYPTEEVVLTCSNSDSTYSYCNSYCTGNHSNNCCSTAVVHTQAVEPKDQSHNQTSNHKSSKQWQQDSGRQQSFLAFWLR